MTELLTVEEFAQILAVRKEKASMLMNWAIDYYAIGRRKLMSRTNLLRKLSLAAKKE